VEAGSFRWIGYPLNYVYQTSRNIILCLPDYVDKTVRSTLTVQHITRHVYQTISRIHCNQIRTYYLTQAHPDCVRALCTVQCATSLQCWLLFHADYTDGQVNARAVLISLRRSRWSWKWEEVYFIITIASHVTGVRNGKCMCRQISFCSEYKKTERCSASSGCECIYI